MFQHLEFIFAKGAEGGANRASTGRGGGDGQQRKNMRWREQRQ